MPLGSGILSPYSPEQETCKTEFGESDLKIKSVERPLKQKSCTVQVHHVHKTHTKIDVSNLPQGTFLCSALSKAGAGDSLHLRSDRVDD